jgi:hypothetical protein
MNDIVAFGKLTDEQYKYLHQWVADTWVGSRACPICQRLEWSVGTHLVSTVPLENGALHLGGVNYPTFLLISPCGYTMHVSAIIAEMPGAPKGID